MNNNIIPYVPIEPRVQAKNDKSQHMFQQLFYFIDQCVDKGILFNHSLEKGYLSLCPDQINDLLNEVQNNEQLCNILDIKMLKISLSDLIYPKFIGEHTIASPIWNNEKVSIWQFKLNQIASEINMDISQNEIELLLDSSISMLKIWRNSLEVASNDKDVIYNSNDLVYMIMDLEQKLKTVQSYLE